MYIPPFTCGVLLTVMTEIGLCIIYGIVKTVKEMAKDRKEKKNGKE